ncbi:hypothetical protein [Epilithonimonas sp. UC225_85]
MKRRNDWQKTKRLHLFVHPMKMAWWEQALAKQIYISLRAL